MLKKVVVLLLTVCLLVVVGAVAEEEDTLVDDGEAVAEEAVSLFQNGDYNADVMALHQKLSDLGYYSLRPESPWSKSSSDALKLTQASLGIEPTGTISSQDDIDVILSTEAPLNLVWDGSFEDIENHWNKWGTPTLVEAVEIDGMTWMHLISTGEKYQGLAQNVSHRSGIVLPELHAGSQYKLTFTAYGVGDSVGKEFRCGFHNKSAEDNSTQEQYWTSKLILTAEPTEYEFIFTPKVDGWFRIMIGEGLEETIEAYFSDVKLVKE